MHNTHIYQITATCISEKLNLIKQLPKSFILLRDFNMHFNTQGMPKIPEPLNVSKRKHFRCK